MADRDSPVNTCQSTGPPTLSIGAELSSLARKEKNPNACGLVREVALDFAPLFLPPFWNISLFLTSRIFLSGLPSDSGFYHTPSFEHRHRGVAMPALL